MGIAASCVLLTRPGGSTGGIASHFDLPAAATGFKRRWTLFSGIVDDTFIYGTSEASHGEHILNVLDTARKNNRFSSEKFQFKVVEASFLGLKWTPEGLNANDKKVEAIANMQPPKDIKELMSFLGMVNYLNRFSPVLAQISQTIRAICNLVKKDVPFQ